MKPGLLVIAALFLVPIVAADTFTEDFESYTVGGFTPDLEVDQNWYDYSETSDLGLPSADGVLGGSQEFRIDGEADGSAGKLNFDLETPIQLQSLSFGIEADAGTQQYIQLQSSSPRRTTVEFYVLCGTAGAPTACALNVRTEHVDTQGQELIPVSNGDYEFLIEVTFDWINSQFCLTVDAVDDGCFDTLNLPDDFQRLSIVQERGDVPMGLWFDDYEVVGAVEGSEEGLSGDIATGLQNFANDINFTSATSLFLLGTVLFIILVAAVAVPAFAFGMDNTVTSSMVFFDILAVLWLIQLEWWPDWLGIALIIVLAALVSLIVRRLFLGITNASNGPSLVAGSLGYFIITSTLLGFSGYAGDQIFLPTEDLSIDDDQVNETNSETQSFGGAVVDCIISLFSDCSRETRSTQFSWLTDTLDSVARVTAKIFGYARAAVEYLFQLLTFQLPIPIIFSVMIVLPPAAALATMAFQTITRSGS